MNKICKMLAVTALVSLPLALCAQTENPRGIYKMVKLIGNVGEVNAPFDQYKICSDLITLTMSIQGNAFRISDNDHQVFNYTGPQPPEDGVNKNVKLVYDSDSTHFTMKWWSNFVHHLHFPKNDWCTEKYESSVFSENGRIVVDALIGKSAASGNPLYGTWSVIGEIDELGKMKQQLKLLHEQYQGSKYFNSYMVFMPNTWVIFSSRGGSMQKIEYEGKKAYKIGKQTYCNVKWLSKNCIAVEKRIDNHRDWIILERLNEGVSPLDRIIDQYVARSGRY